MYDRECGPTTYKQQIRYKRKTHETRNGTSKRKRKERGPGRLLRRRDREGGGLRFWQP